MIFKTEIDSGSDIIELKVSSAEVIDYLYDSPAKQLKMHSIVYVSGIPLENVYAAPLMMAARDYFKAFKPDKFREELQNRNIEPDF